MPEGHTIHRAARDQQRIFSGQELNVSSPQGRFAEGASLLNGQVCLSVEAFGKHLLYTFKNSFALHIHLGLFGRIKKHKLPLRDPQVTAGVFRRCGGDVCFELTAQAPAAFVFLSTPFAGHFSTNGVFLPPGERMQLRFLASGAGFDPAQLAASLEIESVYSATR